MLQFTGCCHYCRKPLASGMFCPPKENSRADSCEVKYTRRQSQFVERRRAARHKTLYGDWKPKGGTLAERINNVVAKAIENGTCYNHTTTARGGGE